jgi:hypothetical protein
MRCNGDISDREALRHSWIEDEFEVETKGFNFKFIPKISNP